MQSKAHKGIGMEGAVARWYERNTRRDLPEFKSLARRMASTLSTGAAVLEVAPGPGFFAIELAKLGKFSVTGVDISRTFIQIARHNAQQEGVSVDFHHGNASSLFFPADHFDLIFCRAAFKNFSNPVGAMQEMHRVLKLAGRSVIVDLRKDLDMNAVDTYVRGLRMNWRSSLFMKWAFRFMLAKRAYTKEQFVHIISKSGFQKFEIQENPIGFEITLTK